MSEICTETTTKVLQYHHKFYCDDCGKFILSSSEDNDGYYEEPADFYIQHVKLKGYYCEECGNKRRSDVIEYARSKNFDI